MLFENIDDAYLNMFMGMSESKNLNVSEGFLKGNMFENEYKPYKSMTYIKPKLKTEREKDLYKVMEYAFMINDYNLFLDLHPEDYTILNKYKEAVKNYKMYSSDFERKYGPLCITSSDYNTFKWINGPWSWEKEDGKYV